MQETHNEFESIESKDWLRELLRKQNVVVTFAKVNGDERVMTCTLQEGVIPKPDKTDVLSYKKGRDIQSDKVCNVWDVNAKGWRSFRWANVKKIDFSLETQNG